MPKRSKRDARAFINQKRHTRYYERWQALRRRSDYPIAVHNCLREVQTLQARLEERQQALGIPPAPPSLFPEMRSWRDSPGDILQYLYHYEPERCPTSLEDAMEFLRDATAYQANLRVWDKRYKDCKVPIDACSRVLQTAECLSQRLPLEGSDLQGRQDIPYDAFGQALVGMLSHCCKPETHTLVPPLAIVAKQYGIRFPVDPAISFIPLLFALWLFPDSPETPVVGGEWSKQTSHIITIHVNLRAPKGDILVAIEALLPVAKGAMGKRRRSDLDYSQLKFRVWDLRQEGMSAVAIAQQLLSAEFAADQKRGGPPEDYASIQKVYDLEKAVQQLIDNVKK